jgi:RNA polymerase sigma-70 factor, ECF subfamily
VTALRARRSPVDRAFERLYKEHVGAVYQYALAVLTNPADAEDVTQQTFLNAYRAFQRGERPHTPHNWLIKIAHNVCRMRWRQSARRPQEVSLEHVPEPAAVDGDTSMVADVLRALSQLPFNQRAALVMREVEGRSYNEIAEILGVTVPAVEALLFRARRKLQARRKALGVLTAVPVPPSLGSFFGGGGGLLAGGGALVSSELALKAAAVVATGVVLGGAGYESVKAGTGAGEQKAAAVVDRAASKWVSPAQRFVAVQLNRQVTGSFTHPGRADTGSQALVRRGHGDSGPLIDTPSSPGHVSSGADAPTEGATQTVPVAVPSAPAVPPAPTVPPAPALPTAPVSVPTTPPPPQLPGLPNVTVPTLPLPPPPPILP